LQFKASLDPISTNKPGMVACSCPSYIRGNKRIIVQGGHGKNVRTYLKNKPEKG
jgi:translation initiation factor 1 (eIF-1/SUI1)